MYFLPSIFIISLLTQYKKNTTIHKYIYINKVEWEMSTLFITIYFFSVYTLIYL